MQILKAVSALMNYPTEDLQLAKDELVGVIEASREIPPSSRESLVELVDYLSDNDLMEVQERYGDLFDRGRALSLLLFEHVHGESRDRGQAMVDLMAVYNEHGFHINVRELPDYIPLYLEFLSHRPDIEAREGLADVAHILGLLKARLAERESPYQHLFAALTIIAGVDVDMATLEEKVAKEERDDTMEAFDKVWQEEQVTFMANQTPGCQPTDDQRPLKAKEEVFEAIHWVNAADKNDSAERRES